MYLSSDECSDESDSSSSTMDSNSDFDDRFKFKFPPPPRLTKSADISHISSLSDSSNSDGFLVCAKRNKKKKLPPIGIFWDIENCQVPKFKSASAIVQRFRTFFFQYYREAEFLVVCDVKKEHPQVIQELHDSQVNLIHVSAISKNAADEKLRQSLRRFAECHRPPCAIVLISGDVNFAADLSDLRYRKKVRVILVHNANVADALILCANDHYSYQELIEDLPHHKKEKALPEEVAILDISNLPLNCHFGKIKARLKILVDNCGGRVQEMHRDGRATIRFTSMDFAIRAQKRINGEDVYGSKIRASTPSLRTFSGRRTRNDSSSFSSIPAYYSNSQHDLTLGNVSWRSDDCSLSRKETESNFFRPILGAQASVNRNQSNEMHMPVTTRAFDVQDANVKLCNQAYSMDHKLVDDSKTLSESSESTTVVDEVPVNLIISNLDSSIGIPDLKRLLINMLKEFTMIYSLRISQIDGATCAHVKVSNKQAAQFVISQLHRQKVGQRRINISYARTDLVADPEQLTFFIISILQEAPNKCMPLFKFLALMKSKYQYTMSISEVSKFKDVCRITEDRGCRIISLTQKVDSAVASSLNNVLLSYCLIHSAERIDSDGWCEVYSVHPPNIMVPLKLFAEKLHNLLYTHMGSLPLQSFQACYEQTFNVALPVDDEGVALEHLVSCVPDIIIQLEGPLKNIKIIKSENKRSKSDGESLPIGVFPTLSPAIHLFCRELVDLLRTMDRSMLPLCKFIGAYHHHFGRQCRVADYGYTKLMDLLESVPHTIQIIGIGQRRLLTLAHPAQVRRFTTDLFKVLKEQPGKQISLDEFPAVYEKILNKRFSPVDYGLCTLEDLLGEIPENTIVVSMNQGVTFIGVPKKKQTHKQIMKTQEFSIKVVELLKHSPYFTLIFHNFVPAFHHHFGCQCKVTECGFTKLIELFEAIPEVVKVMKLPDGEKAVRLTLPKMLEILGLQISNMLKSNETSAIFLPEFPSLYMKEHGYAFKSEIYECETVEQVISNLSDYVQLLQTVSGPYITPLEHDALQILKMRAWSLLLDPPYCKEVTLLKHEYRTKFNSQLTVEYLNELKYILSLSHSNNENYISLTRLYILAAQLYHILYNNGGQICYNNIETCLHVCYGNPIKLEDYNICSPGDLFKYFSFFILLSGHYLNPLISLNRKLSDHQVPLPIILQEVRSEILPVKPRAPSTPDFRQMPLFQTPKLKKNDFIPTDHRLFTLENNSWCNYFSAPDAADLPIPDKLISKSTCLSSDDSNDSGMNSKLDISPPDSDRLETSLLANNDGATSVYARFLNFH